MNSSEEIEPREYVRTSPEIWHAIKQLAREKRQRPTPAEERLWQRLRRQQLAGVQFRRQHSIDRFIVDFFCPSANLIIEVDGEIHQYTQEEDALRQAFLESMGLRVLRFSNAEVINQLSAVLKMIAATVSSSNKPEN